MRTERTSQMPNEADQNETIPRVFIKGALIAAALGAGGSLSWTLWERDRDADIRNGKPPRMTRRQFFKYAAPPAAAAAVATLVG